MLLHLSTWLEVEAYLEQSQGIIPLLSLPLEEILEPSPELTFLFRCFENDRTGKIHAADAV